MNPDNKLLIYLYSDSNFLAVNILENLLSKNCLVNIVTQDTKAWKEKTVYIANKNNFSIFEESKIEGNQKCNYVIFCGGFLDKDNCYDELKKFLSKNEFFTNNFKEVKTLVILPFEVFDQIENNTLPFSDNLGIVYMGDLFGPRMDLQSNLLAPSTLYEILETRTLTLGVGEIFYPIFISDAVKTINKWLFSFGPYGKEVFLLGSQVSGSTFWQENQKIVSGINLSYDNDIKIRTVPRGYEIKTITGTIRFSLLETYKFIAARKWLASSAAQKTKETKTVKPKLVPSPKIKKKIILPKYLKPVVLFVSLILSLPLITLTISVISFFVSYKEFVWGKDGSSENLLLIAKTFSVLTREGSGVLSYIPLAGRIYKETMFAGNVGEKVADIAVSAIPAVRSSGEFFNKILGIDIYDANILSQNVKSELGFIYQNLSFFQIETQTAADNGGLLANYLLTKFDFERFRNIISHSQNLSDNLPSVLGKGERKTYLLLFQNNMELRPTGGFIGSYGLITFDGGRMSDLTVSDVYSADGQLNGHVEPPAPIKNYLGEANWWLRDSNWDPDFPTSAKRAEWFLEKEVGRKVDGVIAVDLQPIKDILKFTGPIFLSDFNMSITDTNLYEKTQSEVQDSFFPGTHKKASFLTALSRNLLSEIGKLDGNKKAHILETFFNNLEGRHVQIYLHDDKLQNDLTALAWDGSVINPDCKDKCYPDFFGIVEANVGVNKANYFVTRKTNIDVNIAPTEIDRHLTLTLKNSANPSLDLAGKYKSYIRFLIPADAELLGITEIVGQNSKDLLPEMTEVKGRQEVGVLVEVLGNSSKNIEFSWRTIIPQNININSYGLYVRKQAGVTDDPLSIIINGNGTPLMTNPKFSLTRDGVYTYNTTLVRDFFSHISW